MSHLGSLDMNIFEADCQDSYSVVKLLSVLVMEEKPSATFELSRKGIRVVIEKNKVIQGAVQISKEFFNDFKYRHLSESLTLSVDLRQFLKCLGVASNATGGRSNSPGDSRQVVHQSFGYDQKSLKIRLENEGSPFELIVEDETESENQTRCTVATQEISTREIFPPVDAGTVWAKMVVKSETLLEMWEDVDQTSEKLWLTMRDSDTFFTMVTKSENAEVEVSLDQVTLPPRVKIECIHQEPITLCFRMALFKMIVRSLELSAAYKERDKEPNKTIIMFFQDGRMVVQVEIQDDKFTDEPMQWVEYVCCSLSEDEEEEFKLASYFRNSLTTNA